jgi:hypothetical protein
MTIPIGKNACISAIMRDEAQFFNRARRIMASTTRFSHLTLSTCLNTRDIRRLGHQCWAACIMTATGPLEGETRADGFK